jgi:CDP-diglyceride synthetase
MRPLTISGASAVFGLQEAIQRSEESRYDHRLHGVLLVVQGMTCPDVARLLGDAPRSVAIAVLLLLAKFGLQVATALPNSSDILLIAKMLGAAAVAPIPTLAN